jgi:hypothetical protein
MSPDLTFTLLRPDDLLALDVRGTNLRVDTTDPTNPKLVRVVASQPAQLVFTFAPQSISEQAYFETAAVAPPPFNPPPSNPPLAPPPPLPGGSDAQAPPGSTQARMSGPSRLVFRLPSDVHEIPYTTAGLLDWSQLIPVLPPAASVPDGATSISGQAPPAIAEPGADETALELPYRLSIVPNVSPHARPAWTHAIEPVEHAGRAELWHTRLASQSTQPNAAGPQEASADHTLPVRVVWSPDFVGDGPLPSHSTDETPFRAVMSARDRDQIVILSAGFSGYTLTAPDGTAETYVPEAIEAERLFLSSLGGWLTSTGAWNYPVSYRYVPSVILHRPEKLEADEQDLVDPTPIIGRKPVNFPTAVAALDLIEWDHVATQGRDHYVRIVYEGFLYPFGHRASLVKVTERKVEAPQGTEGNPDESPVAYLRQRMYIIVREHTKDYSGSPFQYFGREMPFQDQVTIKTKVTPEIDPPTWIGDSSFRVDVGGTTFPFALVGRDAGGADVNFLAPLIFVSLAETQLGVVKSTYAGDNTLRRCVVKGRDIAYADPTAGDTTMKTSSLYFNAEITNAAPPYPTAPFLPSLDNAAVTVPALSALIGQNTAVLVALYGPYLSSGLDANAGVFAQVVGTPPPVAFSADKSGGFARPNLALTALSARKGLVSGDPNDAAAGVIDPAAYFGDIDAKLFGTIDLGELIPLDALTHRADAAVNAPEIRTKALPNRRHPQQLNTIIDWKPQLQDYQPAGSPVSIIFNDGAPSVLHLHVRLEAHLDGTPPQSQARGTLTHFDLRLFGVIGLKIAGLTFNSANGAKSTVALQLAKKDAIGFQGPLAFIQTLADILPPGLFGGSGPSIKLTPTALSVSYTLGLPPITCGVFSLEHIAIMAGLDLPYLDGKPAVEFAFATRARPFLVTVEIFGGGGFVHVVLDADGIKMVEGAIEFGANFSLDLGVASGAVHAMAGIYFQLKGSSSDLTGFIDIGGEVSVLGIISISIDLNLSLSWEHSPQGDLIEGRATLTVCVHVLFFSASVQLSVERSFKAGGGDPKVDQLMTAANWADYAGAFA